MVTDEQGIIGQVQGDASIEGGDSVNWQGHWLYLERRPWPFRAIFEVGFGAYVRHPLKERTSNGFGSYYANPWDGVISRDQLTGILAGLISQADRLGALRLIIHHAAWLWLFAYNTRENGLAVPEAKWKWPDFTGPNIWALELRALGNVSWLFWPLLIVFDLHILFDAIAHRAMRSKDPISFAIKLIIGERTVPTPLSVMAYNITDKKKLKNEIDQYWCGWRKNCDMSTLYRGFL